ncbi:MAG: carboxymuconolactone decarboxylase family protein [Lautropia sp.]
MARAANDTRKTGEGKGDAGTRRARPARRPAARVATPTVDAYRAKGDWNPLWDRLLALDPAFMEAYLAFRDVPHRNGPLPPHVKELILVAINVATTHLYAPGARRHMQNALRQGATPEELLETIQLTSIMGIHACNMAIPILAEEVERFNAEGGKAARKA